MEYGCIGEKLSHSFSMEIHAKLFDYSYTLKELRPDEVDSFMEKKDFKAINVTIPYKKAVIKHLDYIDDNAKKIGAVNTIVNKNGKLFGFNTDFLGMTALIQKNDIQLKNKKVLVLGSGGTSLTAINVATQLFAKEVLRVSRTKKKGFITYEEVIENYLDADVIINTTPVGMFPNINESAVDIKDFYNLSGVVDAVYNPLCSKLILDAKQNGIKAVGGLYMLVAQAAFAAEKFTDTNIPIEKIDAVYNQILLSKKNIALIGMPSSGKSTIGKRVANHLGMQFLDTDQMIVEKAQRAISNIIENDGEAYFRELESDAILQASKCQNTVIATGGGAVLNNRNVELLRANAKVYFLDRPIEKLLVTDDRPLSKTKEKLEKLYNERYSVYIRSADKRIDCVDDIEENITAIKDDFLKCEF